MIVQKHITIDGHDFIKTYSDTGMMIHGGHPESDYQEAYDPAGTERTYSETDTQIETLPDEALNILLGGAEQ